MRIKERARWMAQRVFRGYIFVRIGSVFVKLYNSSDFNVGDVLVVTGGKNKDWEINEVKGRGLWYFDKRRYKRLKF